MQKDNEYYMSFALRQAKKAKELNEVPIGAVIVKDNAIISRAYNNRNSTQNAINHAEMLAISKACKKLKSWRLEGCKIYVTLEPCPMCLGAILNARIEEIVFGAYDKTSKNNMLDIIVNDDRLNHKAKVFGGILEDECSNILKDFFKTKRL
ncbi:MAG: nucleoside deaminase [Clostridia bacterium]|nr:nucleoside deaminase [Clostridia bacterium]